MATRVPILIVDDDAVSRRLLARALGEFGLDTHACEDGMEALQLLEDAAAGLLVLDYDMPGLNGAQVCEVIRAHARPGLAVTPVIMLTGHEGTEHEIECLRAGANDFVTKPVNPAVLRARIETQLRLHELQRELREKNGELEQWRERHERDLEAARLTQQAILPARMPTLAGWEFAAHYEPLIQVGGDLYDWIPLAGGGVLGWIADATGHGASAALMTTLVKWLFRNGVADGDSPAAVMASVERNFQAVFRGKSFLTAACCRVRPESGEVTFCGAGHPPLLVARAGGGVETLRSSRPPFGLRGAQEMEESAIELRPGDACLLYTDGLYDGRLDAAMVQKLVPAPGGSAPRFLEEVLARARTGKPADDLSAFAALRRA